mgnify:CR=1 FL=1
MKISLILATINRIHEPYEFLENLTWSNKDISVEIIIVDQNINIDLNFEKYKYFDIKHIKIKEKGLSRARNIGLNFVTGDIIGFPDDDCYYSPNLLDVVGSLFKNQNIKCLQLPIFSSQNKNKKVARNWPDKSIELNFFNSLMYTASAGLFIKSDLIEKKFNELFGAGSKYGSCEDPLFIFDNIYKQKIKVYYYNLKNGIFHPENDQVNFNKIHSYNLGHVFFWKYIYNNSKIINKIQLIAFIIISFMYHIFQLLIKNNKEDKKYHWFVIKDRIKLLFNYGVN